MGEAIGPGAVVGGMAVMVYGCEMKFSSNLKNYVPVLLWLIRF
jgi:hypothetical protein